MRNLILVLLPFIVSCNIYSPFAQKSSTEDLVEEGRKCLHDGNFACAIEAYSAIPDAETRHEKLCLAYLAQGGMTLSVLINTVTQNSSKVLGDVAQALVPWNSTKSTALDNAKTSCAAFVTAASNATAVNRASLLKFLSLMSHCGIRMAKTDQFVATSNADTACTTAGNNSGTITQSDIGDNTDGSITATGMCATDVSACNDDIASLNGAELTTAGLTDIKNALDSIPAALRTSGGAANVVRAAVRDAVR